MGCLAQGKDPRLCSQPGPGSNPALLCHLSAVTLSPCHPLLRLGAHRPLPPTPAHGRCRWLSNGTRWIPGVGLRVVEWGSESGIPGPGGPLPEDTPADRPGALPGGLHLERGKGWVWGGRTDGHQPPQVPRPVVVVTPGCMLMSSLLGVPTQERVATAEQAGSPASPPPPSAMHVTKMPKNSPPRVRTAKAPTSLPGT